MDSILRTATCLCTVAAAPNFVGQVTVHLGARASWFRIREEGTHDKLSSFFEKYIHSCVHLGTSGPAGP